MITFEEQIRNENIKDIANKLMCAARTAPKARGIDNLVLAVATDDTIVKIAEKMKQLAAERDMAFLNRDAENILNCGAVILFGMKISPLGLNCGACGAPSCQGLAEDIVQGKAHEIDCIFKLRGSVHKLAKGMMDLVKQIPISHEPQSLNTVEEDER